MIIEGMDAVQRQLNKHVDELVESQEFFTLKELMEQYNMKKNIVENTVYWWEKYHHIRGNRPLTTFERRCERYIFKYNRGFYFIMKGDVQYGLYSSLEKAKRMRGELVKHEWDKSIVADIRKRSLI